MRRWRRIILFVALLIGVWQGLVWSGFWSEVLLPAPWSIAKYFAASIQDGTLLRASLVTLVRLLAGYAVGVIFGLPLGVLIARRPLVRDTLGLMALGLQTLPSVCWAPIAVMWFGQTEWAMLFIVVMGSLWSIALATDSGIRNVSPIFVRAAKTMGSRRFHTLFKVILPAALPFIVSGMKQGWAFAWRSLMAAEIYITVMSGLGLGHLLHYGRELHAMDAVVGIMFVIVLVGLVTDHLVFSPVEKFIHVRWGTGRR